MGNYYLFMLTETQNLRIKRLIIFPSAINSLIVFFKLLFIYLTVQQTFSIVNFKARCQCLLWCCLCDFDCYKCIKVITRALSDTLQKLLYKYILHQIQPMILLLIFSYSTDLSLIFSSASFIHVFLSSKPYHFQTCQKYEGMDLYTSATNCLLHFLFPFFCLQ